MRRNEREVTDPAQIRQIIESCHCCRLGFYDEGEVYIVPLSFGYDEQGAARVFYFHGAAQGRKARLIAQRPRVGFELDGGYQLSPGSTACQYSARFVSVVGTGRVSPVQAPAEKRAALAALMRHTAGEGSWAFAPAALAGVSVFRLDVEKLACKRCP